MGFALNNIIERSNYNLLQAGTGFSDLSELSQTTKKFNKINVLRETSVFGKALPLYNHIRNAINHYNVKKNDNDQTIEFVDQHGTKTNSEIIYFVSNAKASSTVEGFEKERR
jgi:cellulose biosynthesis protein BcsQ